MIPEYKLYHGAVLLELVDRFDSAVSIRVCQDSGRSLNYVLASAVGVQIRHATQRIRPWQFSFAQPHIAQLASLKDRLRAAFLVLVCHTDGMVCIPVEEALSSFAAADGSQAWLRADRRKGEWYSVHGPGGTFSTKFPSGIDPLVEALRQFAAP